MNPDTPRNCKPSAKNAPGFRDDAARQVTASAFARGGSAYHAARPSYPAHIAHLVQGDAVLDLGAGTGKLTEQLLSDARLVTAIEPSPDMARVLTSRLPGVRVIRATAEALPIASGPPFSTITCAQAWHWMDVQAASAEAARVAAPGARLVLVWNTLDVTHPWVLRYSRISHSGDVQREGFDVDVGKQWFLDKELRTKWIQPTSPEELMELAKTRSYWLRASEATRAKVQANLKWYLFERLGFVPGQLIPLPYRTDAFVYELASG